MEFDYQGSGVLIGNTYKTQDGRDVVLNGKLDDEKLKKVFFDYINKHLEEYPELYEEYVNHSFKRIYLYEIINNYIDKHFIELLKRYNKIIFLFRENVDDKIIRERPGA